MGGFGSGRTARRDRETVENCLALDVNGLIGTGASSRAELALHNGCKVARRSPGSACTPKRDARTSATGSGLGKVSGRMSKSWSGSYGDPAASAVAGQW